jgi:hypothetical protein
MKDYPQLSWPLSAGVSIVSYRPKNKMKKPFA